MSIDTLVTIIGPLFRGAIVILLAGLGLVVSERSGVTNIGAEGIMLMSCLVGFIGAVYGGNPWLGALCAILMGVLCSLLFAFFVVTVQAPQSVVGAAFNLFGTGFSTTLYTVVFGAGNYAPSVDGFRTIHIPLLSDIPILGDTLFSMTPIAYIAILMVPVIWLIMYKTAAGLRLRAVGENPRACDTVGINVAKTRYTAILVSGFFCGLAGVYLSLCLTNNYTENMTAGKGFMALAAVNFGNYNPVGVLGASLLFSFGDALQYFFLASDSVVPQYIFMMMPYLITVLALCFMHTKRVKPAAGGQAYSRE